LFSAWLSNPAAISSADSGEIESLVHNFPYCQILQSLMVKAAQAKDESAFKPALARASLYSTNRKALFTLVNHPEQLKVADVLSEERDETYYEVIEGDDYSSDLRSGNEESEKLDEPLVAEQPILNKEDSYAAPDEPHGSAGDEEGAKLNKETVDINAREEEERSILENIAGADFFAFDEKVDLIESSQKESPEDINVPMAAEPARSAPAVQNEEEESNEVARYDDDSMPYSFLWWLHKTRKEHADTYQPYVDFKLDLNRSIKKTAGPELNQQIIENIFHLQSPLDEMANNAIPHTIPFDLKRKEEEIIEKFIREEPQIHPPSPDKLDLENKARKSAEDPNDLVSETLASIYTEQMLFHKAIDTYQKLSLKFPEKKAYFADQISELQKKIN
jgi:hypothetical protein